MSPLFDLAVGRVDPEMFDYFYRDPMLALETRPYDKYRVGSVTWLGEKGRMYKATPAYTTPRNDNIFDSEKLGAVAAVASGRKITTIASFAHLMRIDRDLVAETQGAADVGRLWEYGLSRPFTRKDIGHWWVRIRDGNHRIFGAFLGGAPYAWVKVWTRPDDSFPKGFFK